MQIRINPIKYFVSISPVCRKTVLPMLLSHVKGLMEAGQELEICVDILSDMMKLLYCQEMVSELNPC